MDGVHYSTAMQEKVSETPCGHSLTGTRSSLVGIQTTVVLDQMMTNTGSNGTEPANAAWLPANFSLPTRHRERIQGPRHTHCASYTFGDAGIHISFLCAPTEDANSDETLSTTDL